MEKLKEILDGVVGQFVIDDGDIFRGQCTRLPKYFCQQCGINWQGKTGDGKNVVDTLVNTYGGYYGESVCGYRIASAEVKGNSNGHCWVELLVDGQWTIYEQNIPNAGTTTANFGEGVVYSVSKSNTPYKYAYNIRYAGSPIIDAFVVANTPEPTPEPQPTPEPKPEPVKEEFKESDIVVPTRLVDYNGTPLKQYDDTYVITQLIGDRAVLSANRNGKLIVWAAMNTNDIKKA